MESGICDGCGAALLLDTSGARAVCRYCGREVRVSQAVQAAGDGVSRLNALMLSAERALEEDGDFDRARKKYREALDLAPDDYRALWGIYTCEMHAVRWYRATKGFVQFPGDIPVCIAEAVQKYGARAERCAPPETAAYYANELKRARSEAASVPTKKRHWWD